MIVKTHDVDTNTFTYTIPKEFKYLTTDLLPDLPDNAYIHKGVTGCGGTTLALTNDVKYVIAVPMINLIHNKTSQHNSVLGVYGDVMSDEIKTSIENGCTKIMVTYDSLERLIQTVDLSDYKLMVDESQIVVQYAGTFKKLVCNKLVEYSKSFKSVVYMTATPTERKYLPEFLQSLDYYYFNWLGASSPEIKTCFVNRDINLNALSFILDVVDNSSKDIYVFYNSRFGVVSLIKHLLKAKPNLKLSDLKIMFSDNDGNKEYFRKSLGKTLQFDEPVTTKNGIIDLKNKRINFLSSMAFQGLDFYSEVDVVSLIVADSKKKSMRYDISIDLPQIAGRFRKHPKTGFVPNNELYFLWTSYDDSMNMSEEMYDVFIQGNIKESKKMLDLAYERKGVFGLQYKSVADQVEKFHSPYFMCINPDSLDGKIYELNNLAYSSLMSVFSSSRIDFKTLNNDEKHNNIVSKIKDCFSKTDTFDIPLLSNDYKKLLNKNISFTSLVKEYYELHNELKDVIDEHDKENILQKMENVLHHSEDLKLYVDLLDVTRFASLAFSKVNIEKEYNTLYSIQSNISNIQGFLNLDIEKIYSRDELLSLLEKTYKKIGINVKKVKSTDIQKFYVVKNTSIRVDGQLKGAYKIIGIK